MKKGVVFACVFLFIFSLSSVIALESESLFDFGGMYGLTPGMQYKNPATNGFNCSAGYTDLQILGSTGTDYPVHLCYKNHVPGSYGVLDFGGMYGGSASGVWGYKNPATNGANCPSGYNYAQVSGLYNIDLPIRFCYKNHTLGSHGMLDFGGTYAGSAWGIWGYKNPATDMANCPTGYNNNNVSVHGQNSLGPYPGDFPLVLCYKFHTSGGIGPPSVSPEQHFCFDSDQTILKLYSRSNSHASLWNETGDYEICYDEIFGSPYDGDNPSHNCTETNRVISLSAVTNASASITHSSGYLTDICYGNLVCRNTTGNCNADENLTLRLYQESDSNVSEASDFNALIKICCKPVTSVPPVTVTGETYWTDMSNVKIGRTNINDEVKMNLESTGISASMIINYTVYKEDGFLFFWDLKVSTVSGRDSAVWAASQAGNNFYFTAKLPDGTVYSSENEPYGLLNVTSPADNTPPVAVIVKPDAESKHLVNAVIQFEQASYDSDDSIKAIWDFGDGNAVTLLNCNNGVNCNTSHAYTNSGTKIIRLTAKEMRADRNQEDSEARRIYVYSEGINVFAVVSKPDVNERDTPVIGSVNFNANMSYVANCTNCTTFDSCPACPSSRTCYEVSGELNGVMKKMQCFDYPRTDIASSGSGKYNLWFNWTFDEVPYNLYGNWQDYSRVVEFTRTFFQPKKHEADLRVGYEAF